jgi:hypothetical protein
LLKKLLGVTLKVAALIKKTSLITNIITIIHKRKPGVSQLVKKLAGVTLKVEALIKKGLITNIITAICKKTGMSQLVKKTTGATLKVVALMKKQV